MKNSSRLLASFAFLLLCGAWTVPAHAWWNDDWSYRKEISFDLTPVGADITGPLTDVPVLIRLSLGNFQYFADSNPDASDFRFVAADDKTPLKFHIERFDPQAQVAFLWVRMPQLTGGAKTDKVYLYYGNKKAVSAASPADTYDTNQALVYHFGAAKGSPQDATAYKSEPSAFNADVVSASLIGSGVKFSGSQTLAVPANGAVRMTAAKGFTLSAWVRIPSAEANAYVAQLADAGREVVLGIAGNQAFVRYAAAAGTAAITVTQSTQLTNAEWHHLALAVGGGHLILMVDGVDVGHADVTAQDLGGVLTIGGSPSGNFFTGDLDELEVSNVARSADWLKAAARSQGTVAPLVVFGGDTQKESGGGQSYFVTTLRSVTIDGWVIISILGVMLLLSSMIMVTKAVFLARVAGGNRRFLGEFHTLSGDPAALERKLGGGAEEGDLSLEDKGAFGVSPIWVLYHHGMQQTLKRLSGQPAETEQVRTLSAQSIEAIRASLDASMTRLQQRLNSQMVWLTVSISGGPFLGLLGTVVGVMITFAAIAASGEVNINAIAPGTAAALVATVAGLGVAIPCLFGYNYLNTRVKEITADMRVFVDEFVARIAETYS